MTLPLASWVALGIAVTANIGANLCLRGSARSNLVLPDFKHAPLSAALKILSNPLLIGSMVLASVLLISYWYALRGIPVVIAYPLVTGLAMAGLAIAAPMLIGEQLTLRGYLGITFIILGATLLGTSTS